MNQKRGLNRFSKLPDDGDPWAPNNLLKPGAKEKQLKTCFPHLIKRPFCRMPMLLPIIQTNHLQKLLTSKIIPGHNIRRSKRQSFSFIVLLYTRLFGSMEGTDSKLFFRKTKLRRTETKSPNGDKLRILVWRRFNEKNTDSYVQTSIPL